MVAVVSQGQLETLVSQVGVPDSLGRERQHSSLAHAIYKPLGQYSAFLHHDQADLVPMMSLNAPFYFIVIN